MKTFYSPAHRDHSPPHEFEMGRLAPAVEIPERAERVRMEVEARKLGPVLAPSPFPDTAILRVHDSGLFKTLCGAHDDWTKRYGADAPAAIPSCWPARGLRERREGDIESRLGTYCFDTATPIVKGTWAAARKAADIALSGADAIANGARAAFALARPPGHHASGDVYGGYCYLNNVAIAAQWFVDRGLKPAVLDVDYHHGNGTQTIFYRRRDVLFVSIHADPSFAYPHFLGFADELGEGDGEGFNLNLPLAAGTGWDGYSQALDKARAHIEAFGADVMLVSLGLDTFEYDPISQLRLKAEDYLRMGECLARLGKPVLFVFEGGYNVEHLGTITANVLEGFSGA